MSFVNPAFKALKELSKINDENEDNKTNKDNIIPIDSILVDASPKKTEIEYVDSPPTALITGYNTLCIPQNYSSLYKKGV